MTVLAYYKATPEGHSALSAAATQAAFLSTNLIVHNIPLDATAAHEAETVARTAATNSAVALKLVPAPVNGRSPVEEILAAAAHAGIELIVIGIKHRTQVGKILLGSAEQQILLDAPCQVLAVKADPR